MLDDIASFSFGSELAKRYFSFYGSATLSDFCYWAGVSQFLGKQWLHAIEKELSYLIDEKNKKYYYIGEIDENINELPECMFLGGFDPLMLAYKKSRVGLNQNTTIKYFQEMVLSTIQYYLMVWPMLFGKLIRVF